MKVRDIIFAPGLGGFFYDDQAAIRAGARRNGFVYEGRPQTPGFDAVRVPAHSLGVGLVLDDGFVAWGDMMSVQYAGAGGRDPVFSRTDAEAAVMHMVAPRILGATLGSFRHACSYGLAAGDSGAVPPAVQYGVSQALLRAAAHCQNCTMAEIICRDFALPLSLGKVPLYAQSGDDRRTNVDKMILKRVDILPHGLINSPAAFGREGTAFLDYVGWVASRVKELGERSYRPTLHFDLYGWVGLAFGLKPKRIAEFIMKAEQEAAPFAINIESPADFGSRDAQIAGLASIRTELEKMGSDARVVADEWCNSLGDVIEFGRARAGHILQVKMPDVGSVADSIAACLACRTEGVGAYVGGSCAETDLSAQVAVHVACATGAQMLLARPGMGVDEALTIVGNEQERLLSTLHYRSLLEAERLAREAMMGRRGPSS